MPKIYGVLLFFICGNVAQAQFQQAVALTKVVKHTVQTEPAEALPTPKTINLSAKLVVHYIKAVLVNKKAAHKRPMEAIAEPLLLQAERINEDQILLQWNAPQAGTHTTYIIERRFGDPFGDYDSVGTVTGYLTDPAHQSYRLLDNNSFAGQTYYRIGLAGQSRNKGTGINVMVRGYQTGIRVFNSNLAGITILLHKFKIAPHTELFIRDAHGSLVYYQKSVFFINPNTVQVTGLELLKGTYQIEVVNQYNTGVNTFAVR